MTKLQTDFGKDQTPVFTAFPEAFAKETLFVKNDGASKDIADNSEQALRTRLAREWLDLLVKDVNDRIEGCTFEVSGNKEPEATGFFFSPTFRGRTKDGTLIDDIYLGTFNWMSFYKTSGKLIANNLTSEYIRRKGLKGCSLKAHPGTALTE